MMFHQGLYRSKFARFATLGILLLLVTGNFSTAQQATHTTRTPLPFERGEELIYQGEFTRGLLRGVDVAEFRFKATSEHVSRGDDDPVVLHLTGDVISKGLFPRIAGFRFHQHVESVADAEPFTVLSTKKLEEQGKRARVLE